jgi:hypothetical protein
MEIPQDLKILYKHWQSHTQKPKETENNLDVEIIKHMDLFCIERQKIWEKKELHQNPPYTTNKILSQYRFCNIYRELDKQTIQFHTMLEKLTGDFSVWLLNILFCRMVCNPQTVKNAGFLSFDKANNKKVYKRLTELPRPIYGNAYIFPISLILKARVKTREEFFCFYLPEVIKDCSKTIGSFDKLSVTQGLKKILPKFGLNFKFHWTETLIDTAYQYPNLINLFKEFPIGPGSLPTMKKLDPKGNPEETNLLLSKHSIKGFPYLTFNSQRVYLSAENWEGIGCEFRKYSNLKSGAGRKRLYIEPSEARI